MLYLLAASLFGVNAVGQAGRLVPSRNRKPDRMTAHAIRAEVSSLPRALAMKQVCVGSADRVFCRLFAGQIVPFIGHAAIVADMDIPSGAKSLSR